MCLPLSQENHTSTLSTPTQPCVARTMRTIEKSMENNSVDTRAYYVSVFAGDNNFSSLTVLRRGVFQPLWAASTSSSCAGWPWIRFFLYFTPCYILLGKQISISAASGRFCTTLNLHVALTKKTKKQRCEKTCERRHKILGNGLIQEEGTKELEWPLKVFLKRKNQNWWFHCVLYWKHLSIIKLGNRVHSESVKAVFSSFGYVCSYWVVHVKVYLRFFMLPACNHDLLT